jgi:hypothetical protein
MDALWMKATSIRLFLLRHERMRIGADLIVNDS